LAGTCVDIWSPQPWVSGRVISQDNEVYPI
jgi:hypothetical protein